MRADVPIRAVAIGGVRVRPSVRIPEYLSIEIVLLERIKWRVARCCPVVIALTCRNLMVLQNTGAWEPISSVVVGATRLYHM